VTGAEHYREAERILAETPADQLRAGAIALAQVHATLAVAACLGLSASLPMPDQAEWREAAGALWPTNSG
jgi:hypothetical protein